MVLSERREESSRRPANPNPRSFLAASIGARAARLLLSLPRSNYDSRRVCVNPFPNLDLPFGKYCHSVGVYLAGALVLLLGPLCLNTLAHTQLYLANWTFFDAAILSKHAHAPTGDADYPVPVHVTFVDWVPGFCSLFGMLIVNLIDKDRVRGEDGFGDSRAVWRARLILFIGFALMAGGLAGSVALLVLKYVLAGYADQFTYYGYANVGQNIGLMLAAVVLWIAQSTGGEYEYSLSI